jgi:hypothetical protein
MHLTDQKTDQAALGRSVCPSEDGRAGTPLRAHPETGVSEPRPDQLAHRPLQAAGEASGIEEDGGAAFFLFAGARLAADFLVADFLAAVFFAAAFFTGPFRTAFLATAFRAVFFAAAFLAGFFLAADFFAGFFFTAAFAMSSVPLIWPAYPRVSRTSNMRERRYIRFAHAQGMRACTGRVDRLDYRIIARASRCPRGSRARRATVPGKSQSLLDVLRIKCDSHRHDFASILALAMFSLTLRESSCVESDAIDHSDSSRAPFVRPIIACCASRHRAFDRTITRACRDRIFLGTTCRIFVVMTRGRRGAKRIVAWESTNQRA